MALSSVSVIGNALPEKGAVMKERVIAILMAGACRAASILQHSALTTMCGPAAPWRACLLLEERGRRSESEVLSKPDASVDHLRQARQLHDLRDGFGSCLRGDQAARESREGVIPLNPRSVDVLAVTTVPVRRLDLTKSLRFSGILEDDENIHRIIAAFYDGRIDQIYVEHVGKYVEKGQPLAAIYSPELLYVVREYQDAMGEGNRSVARNSAQRLVQYGLSAEQVATLAKQPDNVLRSTCWRRSAARS